jgi:hypothetical protein
MPEGIVLIVRNDPGEVELDLASGRLICPSCGAGALARWGFARFRVLRGGQGFRPRRGICAQEGCGTTHVLLPDVCLLHRVDAAEAIGSVLEAIVVAKEKLEDVAVGAGIPVETVRGWLKRLRKMAGAIAAHFTRWLVALMPGRQLPEPVAASVYAIEMVGAAARAASLRLGRRPPWSWASALSGGMLFSNTKSPWPAPD